MAAIEQIILGYLQGQDENEMAERFLEASGFIRRAYKWLPPLDHRSEMQHLMLERMLLPFEYLTGGSASGRRSMVAASKMEGEVARSMQFLLMDLAYVDMGTDPKNEILRVYAYLGENHTPAKEWLARACGKACPGSVTQAGRSSSKR